MQSQDWMDGWEREFRRVMRESEVPPQRAEVVRGVVRGHADKGIAEDMGTTIHAVRQHKQLAYRTFRVHNREDLSRVIWHRMRDGRSHGGERA